MVTSDPEEAEAAVARGERTVLIVGTGGQVMAARPGRLAILVGDAGDPATVLAADAMELELFSSATGG